MTADSAPADAHRALAEATAAVSRHDRLAGDVERAEGLLAEASRVSTQARTARDRQQAGVDALETVGPGRIWASIRGQREAELARARTALAAAEAELARAQDEVARQRGRLQAAGGEMSELGDVRARRKQALAALEDRHRRAGGTTGRELTDLALVLGTTRAQLAEVREPLQAAHDAQALLVDAVTMLQKARDWSTYDTFLGGGMIAGAVKHDRISTADDLLRESGRALERLAAELADVDGTARLVPVDVDGLTRTFDVWFDNIVTDWQVRDRVVRAHDRTQDVLETVRIVGRDLEQRERDLRAQAEAQAERRQHLLGPR